VGDDARALDLLRKARAIHPAAESARRALLAIPVLSDLERADLLAEEARDAQGARGAAVHAERAAVLETLGRFDEAAQSCSEAVALGGADLAVLRRLARVQLRRGDWKAAIDALTQVAAVAADSASRAEVLCRAAEIAEWKAADSARALELYAAAADAHPAGAHAMAQLARLHTWMGHLPHASVAYEQLAERSTLPGERSEALRSAATLRGHADRASAAAFWRKVLADAPADAEALTSLLQLAAGDPSPAARTERAELRARLASRCTDGRVAALLRVEAARDRMAAGQIDEGIAEYRRALALNPTFSILWAPVARRGARG
jgi:tetratricopeptide (TPR) repeat protein